MTQPPPQDRERIAFEKLLLDLWQDATAGDLETSRNRLTLQPPYRARQAVMHLGVPYLDKIRALGDDARLGPRTGADAIDVYVEQTLKPIVRSKPQKPVAAHRPAASMPLKKHRTGKLRQFVSRIALAGALGLTVVTGSHFAIEALKPDPIVAPAVDNITELRAEFSRTVMGRQLLEMADKGGVTIVYDSTLPERQAYAEYSAGTKQASVRPDLSTGDQVLYLSHELRHAWQDLELGYGEMENRMLTPVQRWVVRRFLEADAAAFSTVFLAQRMQAMHQAEQPDDSGAYFEYVLAKELLREYRSGDGLTAAEYREQVLSTAFSNLGSYDNKHLMLAIKGTEGLKADVDLARFYVENNMFAQADIALRNLKELTATTPSDAEFEQWLRRMGGTSVLAAAKTALQDGTVSREEMFNNYAGLGSAPDMAAATPDATTQTVISLHIANNLHMTLVEIIDKLDKLNEAQKEELSIRQQRMSSLHTAPRTTL